MKRTSTSLLFLIIVAFSFFSLFYLEPSRAQNKASHEGSSQIAFSQHSETLKPVPQMIQDSKSAGAHFEQ